MTKKTTANVVVTGDEVTYPQVVLDNMAEAQKDTARRHTGTVSYSFVRDGKYVQQEGTSCYIRAKDAAYRGCDYMLARIQQKRLIVDKSAHDVCVKFYTWLMKDSPYASAFVSKCGEQVLADKMLVLDCSAPNNIMIGGAIITRQPTEHSYIPLAWYDLTEAGVSPNLAYLLAHMYSGSDNREGRVNWNNTEAGHHCMRIGSMDKAMWRAFVQGKPVDKYVNKPFKTHNSYDKIEGLWGKPEGGTFCLDITKGFNIKDLLADPSAEAVVCLNPFKREVAIEEGIYGNKDMIKAMVKHVPVIEELLGL